MSRDLILVALALVTWGAGEGMFLYFEPIYLEQLGADLLAIGSILGGVGIAMAISYLPAGLLSDRYGRRPMLRLAWLIGTAATWIMALANSLGLFVAGIALYGFTSFVVVPLNSYATQARGKWSVARTITLISASFNLGVIIGPLVGGWIGETFGLKRTFFLAACLFIISTGLIYFIRPQPIENAGNRTPAQAWRGLLNRRYMQFLLVIFFVTFSIYLPQPLSQNYLLNERGLDLTQIGQLISIRSLGIVLLSLLLGQLNPRQGYLLAQLGMAAFSLLLWRSTSLPWYMAGYFLLGSYQTARSLTIAQGRSLVQTDNIGVGYGLLETAMTSAIILAPPLAGLLYQLNPPLIYSTSLILIAAALVGTKFLSPIRSKDV
ncbi:MAG: MFS transporter [Anaerolineales bacterium]|nr:MFS transporter [Anaerolineales bacterium]